MKPRDKDMLKLAIVCIIGITVLLLTGCAPGIGDTGAQGPAGKNGLDATTTTTTTLPVDVVQEDINDVIAYKNKDRALTAQAPLTTGLSCVVQQVASGSCLSTSSPGCSGSGVVMTGTSYTYLYKGTFTQPNSSGSTANVLLPANLRPLFLGLNYRIICTGQLVVLNSDYYEFTVNSDDGSILTVNGVQVVNNDNNHGMAAKTGSVILYRGVVPFSLQYAQTGGGNFGLILTSGGQSIDPKYYYH